MVIFQVFPHHCPYKKIFGGMLTLLTFYVNNAYIRFAVFNLALEEAPDKASEGGEKMTTIAKNTLVTGVSTGIGHATAAAFISKGWRVWGTVRKEADAQRLTKEFGALFHPILLDVANEEAIPHAVRQVEQELQGAGLDGLINNAGVAIPGPAAVQPMDEIRHILEVNFFGALALIRAFLPLLGTRENHGYPPGRIINVTSTAGKLGFPFLGAYVASKHALEGLSQSLRRELMPWGIPVVIIGPGNVKTPIWDKAPDESIYDHTPYRDIFRSFAKFMLVSAKKGMEAGEIAGVIVEATEAGKPRTRYAPVAQKFPNWTLPRLLPDKALDGMMFKMLGMKKLNAPHAAGPAQRN
jgi:NAD(P)-dependent dehydrogenase (short-subunit alcohol dehydrogenase family)